MVCGIHELSGVHVPHTEDQAAVAVAVPSSAEGGIVCLCVGELPTAATVRRTDTDQVMNPPTDVD